MKKIIKYIIIIWIIAELVGFMGVEDPYEERSESVPQQKVEETVDRSKFRNLCEREAYGFSFFSFS